jgi:Transcriptional regulatory protein, C terminal
MTAPTFAPRLSPHAPAPRQGASRSASATASTQRHDRSSRTGFVLYVALDHRDSVPPGPTELLRIAESLGARAREWLPQARTYSVLSTGEAALEAPAARSAGDFSDLLAALPEGPEVHIDVPGRRVVVNGMLCRITRQEFDLLIHLARAAGAPVSRDELHATVWRAKLVPQGSRTVDVHVRRLREKTGLDSLITTVRGAGYRFNPSTGVRISW